MIFLQPLLVGCAPADEPVMDYAHLREVCGAGVERPALTFGGDAYSTQVGGACIDAVGAALNVDWDSFGGAAAPFTSPSDPGQLIVAGALVLVGHAGALLAEWSAAADTPEALEMAFRELREGSEGEDVGALWYGLAEEEVTSLRYEPDLPVLASMSDEGVLSIGNIAGIAGAGELYGGAPLLPVEVAYALAHEVAHGVYPGHVECADPEDGTECDSSAEGSNGSAAWWGYHWSLASQDQIGFASCDALRFRVWEACHLINDTVGFPPCEAHSLECVAE
jgi:hypothetical protein